MLYDPVNVGHALQELVDHVHPAQVAIHCKTLSKVQRCCYQLSRFDDKFYDPEKVIGKNTIAKYLPELACAAGVTHWQEKTPHCLCQYFIAKLANDNSVNTLEVAKMVCQRNINSQNVHIRTDLASLAARFCALNGGEPLRNTCDSTACALAHPGISIKPMPNVPVPLEFVKSSPLNPCDIAPYWHMPHHLPAQGVHTPCPIVHKCGMDLCAPNYACGMDPNHACGMDPNHSHGGMQVCGHMHQTMPNLCSGFIPPQDPHVNSRLPIDPETLHLFAIAHKKISIFQNE